MSERHLTETGFVSRQPVPARQLGMMDYDYLPDANTVPVGTEVTVTANDPSGVATYVKRYSDGSAWQRFPGAGAGRHMVFIPAAEMAPSATGGCAALANIASAANQPDIRTLDFDTTTQEYAQFARHLEAWDLGTLSFEPVWSHAATVTNFGVAWSLQAVAVSNDDTIKAAYGTAVLSVDTGGTTDDVYRGPESAAITAAGTPAAGDTLFFRVSRVVGDAGDTLAVDARLHGIRLFYTTNAETAA